MHFFTSEQKTIFRNKIIPIVSSYLFYRNFKIIILKILVTGTSGFVGRYVLSELLKYQHSIVIAAADISKQNFPKQNDTVEIKEFNLDFVNSYGNLMDYFNNPDMLIHIAWKGLPNFNAQIHEEQLTSHCDFIKKLVKNGIKKITVTGTCLEYGLQEGCLMETMDIKPSLTYPIAKAELCNFISNLQELHDFEFNWLRLFYMYGEGQNPKSILSQLENAIKNNDKIFNMSKGDQQRDYLPIEKVAEYIVKTALQNKIKGIVNCCSGKPITILKLVQDYLDEHKADIKLNLGYFPYPDYEPFAFYGDAKKLNASIGN